MRQLQGCIVRLRTALLLVLLVAVAAGLVGYRWGESNHDGATATGEGAAPAVRFIGTVASLYDGGDGGCIRADPGQGVEVGQDTSCGPFYLSPRGVAKVGDRVTVVSVEARTASGEAIDGFLLSAASAG